MKERARDRIIVALDVPTCNEAMDLAASLSEYVGIFKIGHTLARQRGADDLVQQLRVLGAGVFLDEKYHDIPSTVARYARDAVLRGVRLFNVHAFGGVKMMKAAVEAAHQAANASNTTCPFILGVTILTSIDQRTLNDELGVPGRIEDYVIRLARLAEAAGLDGVIASPHEIQMLKRHLSQRLLIVTPGVRPSWAAVNDQERVMTPGDAIRQGSSYCVIGRPIIAPPREIGTPVDAARLILKEVEDALGNQTRIT